MGNSESVDVGYGDTTILARQRQQQQQQQRPQRQTRRAADGGASGYAPGQWKEPASARPRRPGPDMDRLQAEAYRTVRAKLSGVSHLTVATGEETARLRQLLIIDADARCNNIVEAVGMAKNQKYWGPGGRSGARLARNGTYAPQFMQPEYNDTIRKLAPEDCDRFKSFTRMALEYSQAEHMVNEALATCKESYDTHLKELEHVQEEVLAAEEARAPGTEPDAMTMNITRSRITALITNIRSEEEQAKRFTRELQRLAILRVNIRERQTQNAISTQLAPVLEETNRAMKNGVFQDSSKVSDSLGSISTALKKDAARNGRVVTSTEVLHDLDVAEFIAGNSHFAGLANFMPRAKQMMAEVAEEEEATDVYEEEGEYEEGAYDEGYYDEPVSVDGEEGEEEPAQRRPAAEPARVLQAPASAH